MYSWQERVDAVLSAAQAENTRSIFHHSNLYEVSLWKIGGAAS